MPEVTELAGSGGVRPGTWSCVCLFWDSEVSHVTRLQLIILVRATFSFWFSYPCLSSGGGPQLLFVQYWESNLGLHACALGKRSAMELCSQSCTEIINHYNVPPAGWAPLS